MRLKSTDTFWAEIYCGRKVLYSDALVPMKLVRRLVLDHVTQAGFGVTVTPTEFFYRDSIEEGVIIGLCNYPNAPTHPETVRERALALAELLRSSLAQARVTVMFPDETVTLSAPFDVSDDG